MFVRTKRTVPIRRGHVLNSLALRFDSHRQFGKKSKKKKKSQFFITLHHLSEHTPSCLFYHVRCCTHKGFCVSLGTPVLPCLPLCGKGLILYSEVMPILLSVISNRLNTKSFGQNKIFGVNRSPFCLFGTYYFRFVSKFREV